MTRRPDRRDIVARSGRPAELRRALGALAAGVLGLSLCVATAQADDLTDRRDELEQQASQTERDLSESTQGLNDAAAALQAAEAELAETQRQLAEAEALDAEMQEKLAAAEEALEQARIDVAGNQRELDEQLLVIGEVVRSEYQQRTNLMGVAVLLQTESQSDLQTKMQWSTTMFDTTEAGMDELRALQVKLAEAEQRQAEIEEQVAADRQVAAENLEAKAALEARAEQQRTEVDALVQRSDAARAQAEEQVATDEERYQQLVSERDAVEQRIAERVAAARAAAEREAAAAAEAEREAAAAAAEQEAAAEAEAEQEAAAERREAAEREAAAARQAEAERQSEAEQRAAVERREQADREVAAARRAEADSEAAEERRASTSQSSGGGSGSQQQAAADTSFQMPVSGPITSKYGMRVHPVTGEYKLHDGTDFGVGCGTPILAPHSGTVSERYFNAGYGERLLIDHGSVGGRYVTTVMNHATSYTVGVGQQVSKGQVVGYVGSTGYSTGCHLHLMVYTDGAMADPMRTGLF